MIVCGSSVGISPIDFKGHVSNYTNKSRHLAMIKLIFVAVIGSYVKLSLILCERYFSAHSDRGAKNFLQRDLF